MSVTGFYHVPVAHKTFLPTPHLCHPPNNLPFSNWMSTVFKKNMTFSKNADLINSSLDWLSQQHESCFVSSREQTGKPFMRHNGRRLSVISQYATKNLGICTVQRAEMQLNWRGCPIKIQFAPWIKTLNSEGCHVVSWAALKCTRWPCKIWFNKSSRDWNSLGSEKDNSCLLGQ